MTVEVTEDWGGPWGLSQSVKVAGCVSLPSPGLVTPHRCPNPPWCMDFHKHFEPGIPPPPCSAPAREAGEGAQGVTTCCPQGADEQGQEVTEGQVTGQALREAAAGRGSVSALM